MSDNRYILGYLKQMQSLPLHHKIDMSKDRIRAWYEAWWRYEIFNQDTGETRVVTFDNRNPYDEPAMSASEYIVEARRGSVYVSFSGGKDSTVLADLCARVCADYGYTLYLLFVNTGLEYPEIQKFVKDYVEWLRNTYEIEVQLDIVRPEMRFDEVVKKYGYPVINKRVAGYVYTARRLPNSMRAKWLRGEEKTKFIAGGKYTYLIEAPFWSSSRCCDVMKKAPAKKYAKQTGRKPLLASMASESLSRTNAWVQNGCNGFDMSEPVSNPMAFWTEQDVLHYLKKYGVPYCPVYGEIVSRDTDGNEYEVSTEYLEMFGGLGGVTELHTTGCDRTGCIFCAFGCHLEKEPNRFQRLKKTHPRQYQYCIGGGEMANGKWQPSNEGLGLGKVLDYIGVKYE